MAGNHLLTQVRWIGDFKNWVKTILSLSSLMNPVRFLAGSPGQGQCTPPPSPTCLAVPQAHASAGSTRRGGSSRRVERGMPGASWNRADAERGQIAESPGADRAACLHCELEPSGAMQARFI